MSMIIFRRACAALSGIALVLWTSSASAASGSWLGTVDNQWTNAANWSATPAPAGSETATFNGTGNGNTTVDLSGLTHVKSLVFDTAALAPYTVGSGGAGAQTLTLTNGALIQVTGTAWNDQLVNAAVQLGLDRSAGFTAFRNDSPYRTLTFAGAVAPAASGGTAGTKTLSAIGVGSVTLSGGINRGGATALNLTNALTAGALTLSGPSNGVTTLYMTGNANNTVDIGGGGLYLNNVGGVAIYSTQGGAINGPGKLWMSTVDGAAATGYNYADLWVASGKTLTINAEITGLGGFEVWSGPGDPGTFVLTATNTFPAHVTISAEGTISCSLIGVSGVPGNLGAGTRIRFGGTNSKLIYTGAGETNNRQLVWNANGQIHQNGSGHLNFSGSWSFTADSTRTITLTGSTEGTGEISGSIGNRSASYPTSITKSGTGTWTLSGANALAGNILVSGGTLRLAGASGALVSATNYTVNAGATLLAENGAAANNANRLSDTATVTLRGGTLAFLHSAGATNYSEAAGALVVDPGASTVTAAQAAAGQTSALTFASLSRAGSATVNFVGEGLGASDRNRIFITGQPEGVIGPWATVNGTDLAAYDSAQGVIPASTSGMYTDIAARGSVIPNTAGADVRINSSGAGDPIALADSTTAIETLLQNTATAATVDTALKTFQADNIVVAPAMASVTVGLAANDGTLAPATAGGTLLLANESGSALTVNARIADSGPASSLLAYGSGPIVLAGSNTFSGSTAISGGTLTLANSYALQNSTLLSAGVAFDESVASHAFTLGGLSGALDLALEDNAASPNPVALTVGNNGATTAHSGALSGSGSLVKTGSGTLTLSTANTYSGGTSVQAGQLAVGHANGLGTGAVVNDALLDLAVGNATYSGLSTALSGTGTVNVTLGATAGTTYLDGDYSGFTGVWNLGKGVGGKARMNGPDNPAATIHVRSNATVWVDNGSTHTAALMLYGGDTGESYGQLRLQADATWAGPVYLCGDITSTADGYFGGPNIITTGFVSGVVSDLNGAHPVQKVQGNARTYLTCPTNTFGGQIWIRGGTLGGTTLRNVGQPSSFGQPADATAGTIKLGTGGNGVRLAYLGPEDSSTDRIIDLATTTGTTYLEQSGDGKLTFTSDLAISAVGAKALQLEGAGSAAAEFAGKIADGAGSVISISKAGAGTWALSGVNTYSGGTVINTGKLIAKNTSALGTGALSFPTSAALELAYDSDGETPYVFGANSGATVSLLLGGTTASGVRHAFTNAAIGSITLNVQGAEGASAAGTPALTIPSMNLSAGGSGTATMAPLDAELHLGTVAILLNSAAKTLKLDGTNAASTVTGCISNGLNTVSLVKDNLSVWTLSGSNTYSGATTLSGGALRLAGADGAILGSSALNIGTNGLLALVNTPSENNANRLGDAIPLTLSGARIEFSHAQDAADYGETAGALTVSAGDNTVAASRADSGRTSALTFASLSYLGGTLDFAGDALGEDARNQILFTGAPTLYGNMIGPWATVNGTNFASYGAFGVTAYTPAYTNLAARAGVENDVVPDDANAHALIAEDGDSGSLTLAGDPASSVATLTQANTNYAATVDTAAKTFRTLGLTLAAEAAALTIGSAPGDGTLTALSAGGILTLKNDSAHVLTVNAALADHTSASPLAILGGGPVTLAGPVSHTGPTLLSAGTLTLASDAAQTLPGVISGAGSLVKNGTNVLQLLASNTYVGSTVINAGTVRANQNTTFGPAAGGSVTIADGATLDVGCTPDVGGTRSINSLDFGQKLFVVQGAGVDGNGAIVNSSTGSQQNAFEKIVLAGDTRFGGASRWDIRGGTFAMNGYTLTKVGTSSFIMPDTTVTPGDSGKIDVVSGIVRVESGTQLSGSSTNTLTVRTGAEVELYRLTNPQQWSLLFEPDATFDAAYNSTGGTQNRWAGPIELQGAVTLTGGSGYIADLQGPISGSGPLTKTGDANITISGTNSTYTGKTSVQAGTLTVKSLRNVGEACSLGQPANAADGALSVGNLTTSATLAYTGGGDTTDRALDFAGTTGSPTVNNAGTGPLVFTSEATVSGVGAKTLVTRGASAPLVFAGRIADGAGSAISLTKRETNDVILSGNNAYTGVTLLYGGTLTVAGDSACSGEWRVNGGTLVVTGTNQQSAGGIFLGYTAGSNALMRVLPGSRITGTGGLRIGNASNSSGALYVSGGLIDRTPGTADDNNLGLGINENGTYGYLNMSGGVVTNKRFNIGGTATKLGAGVARISGGTLKLSDYILLARTNGCVGVLTLDGGLIDRVGASQNFSIAHSGGCGEFNLTGGTLDNSGRDIRVRQNNRGTGSTGVVNVCAGTLTLNAFQNDATLGRFWLNFSGGTLKPSANHTTFLPNTLTRVTVNGPFGSYAGGAVIDTAGFNVSVAAPLQAPAGSGVYAIPLASSGSGYIGEPYVAITGGGGEGATAVANMEDDGSGSTYRVASVTVTTPGWNYATPPSVTFIGGGGAAVQAVAAAALLQPAVSGGLTKAGAGILTLAAANTYSGATTISNGTLRLGLANALPPSAPVTLAGGTYDLGGFTVTNALTLLSGALTNGTLRADLSPAGEGAIGSQALALQAGASLNGTYFADVSADGSSDLVAVTGSISLSGLALQLVNPAALDIHKQYTIMTVSGSRAGTFASTNLPNSRWHVVFPSDGSVKLLYSDGTLLRVK